MGEVVGREIYDIGYFLTPLGRRYYLKDHLGSTRVVLDGNGNVVETRDHYPFGMEMPGRSFVSGQKTKENYTGHELDDESGLLYMGARYMDPAIGRFLTVDLLADDAKQVDKSPYAYVWNNPVNLTDPDGRCPWCVGAIVGAALDYGTQVAINYAEGSENPWTNIDMHSVGVSGGAGAVGAGLISSFNKGIKVVKAAGRARKALQAGGEAIIDGSVSAGQQLVSTGEVDATSTAVSVLAGGLVRTPVRDAVTDARSGAQNAMDRGANTASRRARNAGRRLTPSGDARPTGRPGKVARLQQEAQDANTAASQHAARNPELQ